MSFLFTKTPLLFLVQSFWRDEAFSFILAKRDLGQIFLLTAKDFNPPLYYIFLHYWMKIFGGTEVAIRGLSFIFYLIIIYVAFIFLKDILKLNPSKASFYILFLVINPQLVYYAFEARMYTQLAAFATLSFYFFYKKKYKLYIITTVLALYTNYFAVFIPLIQIVASFLLDLKQKDKQKLIKSICISFALFLPWLLFVIFSKNLHDFSSFWLTKETWATIIEVPAIIYTGYERSFDFFNKSVLNFSAILILLLIVGWLTLSKKNIEEKKIYLYLLLWGVAIPVICALVSFFYPVFLSRYLIFCAVGLVILIIYVLDRLPIVPKILIITLMFFLTLNYQRNVIKYRQKADLRKTIGEIKYLAKKNDYLYVTNELDFFTAQYYFGEDRVFIYGKSYDKLPSYVGRVLIPKEKVVNILPQYPQKAFILQSSGQYEIAAVY